MRMRNLREFLRKSKSAEVTEIAGYGGERGILTRFGYKSLSRIDLYITLCGWCDSEL